MKNAWSYTVTEDLKDVMRLLGCREKYVSGDASDFEKFRELICIADLASGTDAIENFACDLSALLGRKLTSGDFSNLDATTLWKEINLRLGTANYESVSDEKENKIVYVSDCKINDEKYKNIGEITDVSERVEQGGFLHVSDAASSLIMQEKNSIYFNFENGAFNRPDRYNADKILGKIKRGEKCNYCEKNLLLCQILCEILYDKKYNSRFLIFNGESGLDFVKALTEYLCLRKLDGRILLLINEEGVSAEELKKLCLSTGGAPFVTPLIHQNVIEEIEENGGFLERLSRIIPCGAIRTDIF